MVVKKNKKIVKSRYSFTESRIPSQIMGEIFDPSIHQTSDIEKKILNCKNKDVEEIKVLFISEASYLHTGFSTYTREVLKRLSKNPKFTIAELGAYGQSVEREPRAKEITWKYYRNMPVTQQEDQEYKANYKDNQFGLWQLPHALEDFKPDVILCVPPGEMVLTKNGYKAIETINVGEEVLTHKNRFRKVTEKLKRASKNELYGIYVNGCTEPLRVTGEHPVLVYRKKNQTNQKKSISAIYENEQPEFIPAKHVRSGDMAVLSSLPMNVNLETLDLKNYLVNYIKIDDKIYPANQKSTDNGVFGSINVTPELCRLLGYIYCDGSIGHSSFCISFDNEEEKFAIDALEIANKTFGVDGTIKNYNNQNIVYLNSVILCEFLKSLTSNKTLIPDFIMSGSKEIKEQFISGCIRADGSYKCGKQIRFHNTKKGLAYSVRSILCSLGYAATIVKDKKIRDGYNNYMYNVCVSEISDIIDIHNFVQKYDITNIRETHKTHRVVNIINGHMISSINTVRKLDYSGQVYNLSVEEDNSYVLQWTVHNCHRDWWMDKFIFESPIAQKAHIIYSACVDSYPQQWEWLKTYNQADTLMTYSHFGKRVIEEQSRTKLAELNGVKSIDVQMVAQAGASPDVFKPLDKIALKTKLNIDPKMRFIGTVMRNQPRKLFTRLIESFALFLQKYPDQSDDIYLLLHTGIPDVGFNIPESIHRYGIEDRVVFSWICNQCNANGIAKWGFIGRPCPNCNKMHSDKDMNHKAIQTPNTAFGLSDHKLNEIYNLMDIYIQASICFQPDTNILTSKGWQKIKDSQLGDHVVNSDGSFSKILDVKTSFNNDLVNIKAYSTPFDLTVTDGHPMYRVVDWNPGSKTSLRERMGNRIRSGLSEDFETEMVEARNLKPEDILIGAIPQEIVQPDMAINCPIDEDVAKWFGLFVGDGYASVYKNGVCPTSYVQLTTNINDNVHIDYTKIIANKINKNTMYRNLKEKRGFNAHEIRLHCSKISKFMRDTFYDSNRGKIIPSQILYWPHSLQKAFLEGLIHADGSDRGKGVFSLMTIYPQLAQAVQTICERLGFYYNTCICKKSGNRKNQYKIEINMTGQKTCTRNLYHNNQIYRVVKSVQGSNYEGPVVNLEVEGDHTLVVSLGTTHNCEGDGLPVTEAKMAGVPTLSTDYSSLYEKNRMGGGLPIKVSTMYTECETMQNRAIFDIPDLASKINKIMSNDLMRTKMSKEARDCAVKYYNWDLTAKKWESAILNADLKGREKWVIPTVYAPMGVSTKTTQEEFDLTYYSIIDRVDQLIVTKNSAVTLDLHDSIVQNSESDDIEKLSEQALEYSESKWNFIINPGEEYIANKTDLKQEAFINDDRANGFIVATLTIKPIGLDLDEKFTQKRMINKNPSKDSSVYLVVNSPNSVQLYGLYDNTFKQKGNERMLRLKEIYAALSECIILETAQVGHIIRRINDE